MISLGHVQGTLAGAVTSGGGGVGGGRRFGHAGRGVGHERDAAGGEEDVEGDEAEVLGDGGLARGPGQTVVAGAALLLDLHNAQAGAVTAKAAVLGATSTSATAAASAGARHTLSQAGGKGEGAVLLLTACL